MYDHKVHICVALTKSSSCFSSPFTAVGVHIRCFGQVCYQGDDPPSPAVHHDRLPQPLPLPPLPSCLRSAQFPLFTASENATCQGFCRQEDCGWSSVFTTTSPLTHTHTHTCRSSLDCSLLCCQYTKNVELQMPMPPILKRKGQENDQF